MGKVFLFFLLLNMALCATGERGVWSNGMSLLGFLKKNQLPSNLYYNLSSKDKELASEVQIGSVFYILRDESSKVLQVLIPVSEDVQMHIYATKDGYSLDFIPILVEVMTHEVALSIQKSPYQDLLEATKDPVLTNEVISIYRKSLDLKKLVVKNDRLLLFYTRKYRLGRTFGLPEIQALNIETRGKSNYVFAYKDSFYDNQGKEMTGFLLEMPLQYQRISSPFSHGRFHPILKTNRPHYGVDLVAPKGSPVYASGNGKVIYSGYKGGYGNVIEIGHEDNIKTLYGHMSKLVAKSNSYVKKGQLIGYVGNTGLSTGPHLHFGVYKNNRPVDPMRIVKTAKKELKGVQKQQFLKVAKKYETKLQALSEEMKLSPNHSIIYSKYVLEDSHG